MYSLLPDETGCKSVLGNLVYMERKHFGFSPKVVDVTMPTSRLFGHVEYKLEISVRLAATRFVVPFPFFLATPHNSIDSEPRLFGLITRYKELSALYSTLASIHRSLYLKGKFPSFAEPKYFGATDPQTIAERRNSIEEFLQFVLNNEVLCKSVKFQQFLESTREIKEMEAVDEPTKSDEATEAMPGGTEA
ncbi:hypothetical protein niasHS_011049 [Heterodera schachtii]|uniref:PX domain-containing protein n=2 Tax=Heterodera TaxID=34509 RepID=A0ABD2IVT8_HETSC